MFPEAVNARLSYLDKNLYAQSDKELTIVETQKGGEAAVHLDLNHPAVQFKEVDKHRWDYLAKRKCADSVVFQYAAGRWTLHIFEIKTTVGYRDWENMQSQCDGAFLNALAMAGFLGIDIANITVHSCFRKDKLNHPTEPAEIRDAYTNQKTYRNTLCSWHSSDYKLQSCDSIPCRHEKTQLDERGTGKLTL
jgi:hypothetical protein